MQLFETRSLNYSLLLHAAILIIAAVGLPMLLPKPPEPQPLVMSVEILPMGEKTNVKPSDKEIAEEKHAPTPKITKPIPPIPAEKPKPTPPSPTKPQPPTPEEKKPFDPMEGAEPIPDEKPKPADKPKENKDFKKILEDLRKQEQAAAEKAAKDKANTEENKTKSDAPYDASQPMSLSEKDAIQSQFIPCWNQTSFMGAKDVQTLTPLIHIELQADGTVLKAYLDSGQQTRYNSDSFFRAAADSALRAVHQCSPLKNLPPEKFNSWREIGLTFTPTNL